MLFFLFFSLIRHFNLISSIGIEDSNLSFISRNSKTFGMLFKPRLCYYISINYDIRTNFNLLSLSFFNRAKLFMYSIVKLYIQIVNLDGLCCCPQAYVRDLSLNAKTLHTTIKIPAPNGVPTALSSH